MVRLKNKTIFDIYSKDNLLTNIMIYLVTNSFNTASWIYFGRREEGGRAMNIEGKVNISYWLCSISKGVFILATKVICRKIVQCFTLV